ncbi:MAG: hypothetical protein HQK81_14425 [Desulfovibrionaceae bacterium]|nr:hypothetical protein [Desulfovibrionaceae bacterium]
MGILCAIPTYGLAAVAYACDQALGMKVMSKDVVLNLLSRDNEVKVDVPIALPHRLLLREEPVADCGRYDALLGEVSHVTQ